MTAAPNLFSLEAEQAVIGAAILDGDHVVETAGDLRAGDMFDPAHGAIWAEILARRGAGSAFDAVALGPWWRQQPAAEDLGGGVMYLFALCESAARMAAVIRDYAALIRDLAARRRTLEAMSALSRDTYNLNVNIFDAIADLRGRIEGERGETKGVTLAAAWRDLEASLGREFKPRARFGLHVLDRRLGGMFSPDLIVLGGRPAMGKTSLAVNIGVNASLGGASVHMASMEMGPDQIAGRVASRVSRAFEHRDLRIPARRPNPQRVWAVRDRLPERFMIDRTAGQTIAHLESQARETRRAFGGLDLVIVDYLQLMRAPNVKDARKVAEITAITQGLKELASRLDVCVLALSQINRGVEGRDDKRPGLSDLRESGSIEQDADVVMFVYREEYYLGDTEEIRPGEGDEAFDKRKLRKAQVQGQLEIITAKNRHGMTGSDLCRIDLAHDTIMDPIHVTGDAA